MELLNQSLKISNPLFILISRTFTARYNESIDLIDVTVGGVNTFFHIPDTERRRRISGQNQSLKHIWILTEL